MDLILAADVVWLDELVEPLVRTLERLTGDWVWPAECNSGKSPAQGHTPPLEPPEEGLAPDGESSPLAPHVPVDGTQAAKSSGWLGTPRRAIFAYQLRSKRTAKALHHKLGKCFHVREVTAEVRPLNVQADRTLRKQQAVL